MTIIFLLFFLTKINKRKENDILSISNKTFLIIIDLNIEYHLNQIEINIKWSLKKDFIQWIFSYIDDECTLPLHSPFIYLCSSSSINNSLLNPIFYSYWFVLEHSFYSRLFSHMITDENHLILLISLSDGRILVLPESPKDFNPIIWYTSSSPYPIYIIGINYDINTNLLDAILSSKNNSKFPKLILNHFILCEHIGSLILLNSQHLRRILLDNFIKSPCIYLNNLIYLTKNEIRSISILNLLKPINDDDLINQTKILRFGHFNKLIVDGQEIILYYENGTFERLNNLLPPPTTFSYPSRMNSLLNQTKKLTYLTTTITNLQTHAYLLKKFFNKLEIFYQLNLLNCLKFHNNQWKLFLNEQQLRIFQPQDFLLILICYFSSTNTIKIYQLNLTNNWIFQLKNELILNTCLCQSILIFRYQNHLHYRLGFKKLLLPLHEQIQVEEISIENYFPNKYKSFKINSKSIQQYHLVLTIRNESALNFKKLNLNLIRHIDNVNIECKQQEIKVDTDAGLVDALTIQIILSSSSIQRIMITFSALIELFYENKTMEEKNFIKQTDIIKLIDLIEDTQKKSSSSSNNLEDLFLNLLQIRIYLSMFRLGSNYTVQVY